LLSIREEALASWDKAIELENVVEHWKNKAFAYSSLGKTEEVIKCLEHAVELDSKNEEMLLNLALLYQQTHKQEQAMNAVDKLLMLNPLNTLAHMLKATLLTQQGPHQNIKEAINIMKRALDIDSNDPSLILNYSKILFLDEQYAECCKQLERMFNLGPLTSKKHQQEAIELYQLSKTLSSRIEQQKKQNAELLNTIKERDRTLANIHQSNTKTATTTTTTTTTTDKQNNRDKDQKRSIRNSGKQLENNKQLKKSKRNRKRPSKDPTTTLSTNLLSLTLVATVACVVGFSVWTYFSRRNK
jgi:tetratricopeptide (TPR) repeat protein